ncbi:MAG: SPOR domain-containing protein [Rickettsiales bacterium]|jgi:cell division septation protein DedD|nr:SPOR domain-containing protein [Rickettsiales bacterium]
MADNNIDLLDLNDDLPELDSCGPFSSNQNKGGNLWKLLLVGGLALVAAGYVVYKLAGKSGSRDEVAAIVLENSDENAPDTADMVDAVNADPDGLSQRVIEDRKDVKFNPDAGNISVSKPKPMPSSNKAKTGSAPKATAATGKWSAQVGSFSNRASAEREQKHLQTHFKDLFSGKTISIISATLPNGSAAFRLRVPNFSTGAEANAFCQRAAGRGLNCYAVPTGK